MIVSFWIPLLAWLMPSPAGDVTLQAPDRAAAGATIEITWTGTTQARDFVTVVRADAPEGTYDDYAYAPDGHWTAHLPDAPGAYEIRFMGADSPYPTLARLPLTLTSVDATLHLPKSINAGAVLTVQWTGPDNHQDFVTIVARDAPERTYRTYKYTKEGNPLQLAAPDVPGAYQVRYCTGKTYATLAAVDVDVVAVSAQISAPDSVAAGAPVDITWTGPDNPRDFISIVAQDAPEGKYNAYKYTSEGNPVTLAAPDVPGTYEIRYLSGAKYLTLGTHTLTVGATSASLQVAASVQAGATLDIGWEGPANAHDYITIVKAGTPEGQYAQYRYVKEGNPVALPVPEEPGAYEVRYNTGGKNLTLAASPLDVTPVTATVTCPAEVKSGTTFEASWEGPGNPRDYLAVVPEGADVDAYVTFTYTHTGNPTEMRAPREPGRYRVAYLTGAKGIELASAPVTVLPPDEAPGYLKVYAQTGSRAGAGAADGDGVEVILDASGSMLQRLEGKRRIDIARDTLSDLVRNTLPAGNLFALRVFGHREADSCRTDLEVPLAPLNPDTLVPLLGKITAKNLAKTPIAASLALVAEDLAAVEGRRLVVLITDGEETCGGDPAKEIEALKASGIDVRLNIVGFALNDAALKATFRNWADLGGGTYFDAAGAAGLGTALTSALALSYVVHDTDGAEVARGRCDGETVTLAPGTYTVHPDNGAAPVEVVVVAEETAKVTLP